MKKNLKKRIITSIFLFSLLFLMLINNYALGYFLIVAGVLSILEFSKITKIILKSKRLFFLFNIFFMIYIFSFCSGILVFSSFIHLKILIFVIIITCVASDIGGFVFGKILKGPKLTKISPNKTISGSIGSLICSMLVIFFLIYYLTQKFDPNIIILGIITSIGSQLGDLFFSFLKRKSYLNDTGNILPGHGGILDRIDGILLGVPFGFITLLIIY